MVEWARLESEKAGCGDLRLNRAVGLLLSALGPGAGSEHFTGIEEAGTLRSRPQPIVFLTTHAALHRNTFWRTMSAIVLRMGSRHSLLVQDKTEMA